MRSSAVPALEADNVAHNFGGRWILRGASLTVHPGEAVALLGRNGSGKTTLLRIAATLLRPSRGAVRVYGHDVVKAADAVRGCVGVLGHAPALYEDLTAGENLSFAFRMYGERPDPSRIQALLEGVGLGAETHSRVRGFSAGMRRRLSLARVLIRPPRLLLLDEPYASFDPEGIAFVNTLVEDTKARGDAVLLVTHDPERASVVADRMVRLVEGRVVEAVDATDAAASV